MKQSMRAKRMQRHHKRNGKQTKLSLVSLMDIFTILVFFLMLNASDIQVLQADKSVSLPESIAEGAAKETLVLMITSQDVLLQGKPLVSLSEVRNMSADSIPALKKELDYQASRQSSITLSTKNAVQTSVDDNDQVTASASGLSITIMGDKLVAYDVLQKIMSTCAQAGYTNISLAVENKASNTPVNDMGVKSE